MNIDLTNLFDEKTERRLQNIARSEYNQSSYGHGKWDPQSAEAAVASEILALGKHSEEQAYEIAHEIAARVTSAVDEENEAIWRAEEAARESRS